MANWNLSVLFFVAIILISLSCALDAKRSKSKSKKSPRMTALARGDPVLQFINKNFVSLKEDERKMYMVHYQRVVNELVARMRAVDPLFDNLYSRLYWAGSYYDGLKVGRPEEYDVDLVLKLPIPYSTIDVVSEGVVPPFVKLWVPALEPTTFRQSGRWTEIYRPLDKWTDADGFLRQDKLREWIESCVSRTFTGLRRQDNYFVIDTAGQHYLVDWKKTGPAMTFLVVIPGGVRIDIDLVPVIEFRSPRWPPHPIRDDRPLGESWFAVPKPNTRILADFKPNYWRLGFHDQERAMINGLQHLKPVCKLIKKLRDNLPQFKGLASYYIKTIFLWEVAEGQDPMPWSLGITAVFLKMLRELRDSLRDGVIPYFWNPQYNLIGGMSIADKTNLANYLDGILRKINRLLPDDPTVLADYLLTPEEMEQFRRKYRPQPNYIFEGVVDNDAQPAEPRPCNIL